MFCLKCEKESDYIIREENEAYNVKGTKITIKARVMYCKECGEQVWNDDLDEKNISQAYAEYRKLKGLLQPEQIKEIREKYKMTQVAFARILGFGDKTITRYENGSLQDAAQNNLIELMNSPENFEKLLYKNRELISKEEYQRASGAIKSLSPKIIYIGHNGRDTCQNGTITVMKKLEGIYNGGALKYGN